MEGIVIGQDGIEAGPVDPEQDGANHGEDVGAVAGSLQVLGFIHLSPTAHHGDREPKVSAEGVDKDGATYAF